MTSHKKFLLLSLAWCAIFMALGAVISGGLLSSVAIATVSYLCPFGGLWCSAAVAYYA